ncbi:fumarylacetoacetate hydrolase family protein [Bradyrhizobium centrolobii]|uniref:fumarylacetoacetate hydrolase family protein n=1 Tax=Bradyrhizobium centrolobii TaxID=1505087 RepID=UPI0009EDF5E3
MLCVFRKIGEAILPTTAHPMQHDQLRRVFGPWLVTTDEIPDPATLSIETRLNGAVMQKASISDLVFDVPQLIAYCSTFTILNPGDVIITGTTGGVGAFRNPQVWLRAGDTIEVDISGVGVLSNPIAAEPSD